jgi:hypothetical protein
MPKHLNRPTHRDPPYPWKDYVESIEAKVDRLQAELDKLRAVAQQPSLFGEQAPAPVSTIAQETPPERLVDLPEPDQNAMPGFRGQDTSRHAAQDVFPRTGTQRATILLAVFRKGQFGMTFDEVRAEEGIYSADRRMSELADNGWLERTERERRTRHGSMATVMVTTQKAIEWLRIRMPQDYATITQR